MNGLPPELIEVFLLMLRDRTALMRLAIVKEDRATLVSMVHQVAGTGSSFGYPVLTEEGRRLEADLVAGVATKESVHDFVGICDYVLETARV